MDDIRVLVTGVGGAAGVVALKSFKKNNIYTIGVNCFSLTAGFKLADDYSVVPLAKDSNFIPTLLSLCKEKKVSILLPTVDEELMICAQNRELFEEIGLKVAISDGHVIQRCLDKWLFYLEMKNNNLPVASTWLADNKVNLEELVYPVIIKPRTGRGSRGIHIITKESDLRVLLDKYSDYIIQEYVDGDEYTVDTLSDFQGKAIIAVPRKRIEIKGGVCWKGNTELNHCIMETSMKVVESLGIKGPACIQLKLSTKGEIKIFEINPRIGGTTSLSVASGVDIPYLTVKLLLNREILKEELKFKKLYISRYFEDVFFEDSELQDEFIN